MTSSNCSWIPANDLDECGLNIHDCSFNAKSGFLDFDSKNFTLILPVMEYDTGQMAVTRFVYL